MRAEGFVVWGVLSSDGMLKAGEGLYPHFSMSLLLFVLDGVWF